MEKTEDRERKEAQEQLTALLDVGLGILALITLCLLLVELTLSLPEPWSGLVVDAQLAIWVLFVIAFVAELSLAPSRTAYLRSNWLVALSLALPALRAFRVARSLRFLRSTRAVRALGLARVGATFNRATRVLSDFFERSRFTYLVALTVIVVLTGGVVAYFFERGAADTSIDSVAEGLWWSATLVTTVNAEGEPVTLEGRVIGLLLRVFGVGVFGYLTAHVAAYLLGGQRLEERRDLQDMSGKLDELRRAVDELSARVEGSRDGTGAPRAAPRSRARR